MIDLGLTDKVAIVTGGSSGIGLSVVDLLLSCGAKVAFCGRDAERLNSAKQKLLQKYSASDIFAMSCDVLDVSQVNEFAKQSLATLGSANILINNAGQGRISTFASTTDEEWMQELHLKFFSIIYPVRAFLEQLEQNKNSSIVCANSLLASQPEPHMVATAAARAGIKNLIRSLATEFAPQGIRVNSILIGLVDSGQWRRRFAMRKEQNKDWEQWSVELAQDKSIPLKRLGDPLEAARAIVFLASPWSSYTTGSYIDVSGGLCRAT